MPRQRSTPDGAGFLVRNSVDRTLRVLDPEGMDVRLHADPEDFWNAAGPIYESDPIRHTIPLTVITGLRAEYRQRQNASGQISDVYGTKPLLVTITEHGETVGAAYCTPPWPLGVSGVTIDHIPALAEFLRDIGVELAGVSGPCEVADAFAEKWGSSTTAAMRMRCYRLAELIPPDVPGSMRLAQAEDIPLLEAWEAAFSMMHRCRSGGRTTVVRSFNRWHWETRTGCGTTMVWSGRWRVRARNSTACPGWGWSTRHRSIVGVVTALRSPQR